MLEPVRQGAASSSHSRFPTSMRREGPALRLGYLPTYAVHLPSHHIVGHVPQKVVCFHPEEMQSPHSPHDHHQYLLRAPLGVNCLGDVRLRGMDYMRSSEQLLDGVRSQWTERQTPCKRFGGGFLESSVESNLSTNEKPLWGGGHPRAPLCFTQNPQTCHSG